MNNQKVEKVKGKNMKYGYENMGEEILLQREGTTEFSQKAFEYGNFISN